MYDIFFNLDDPDDFDEQLELFFSDEKAEEPNSDGCVCVKCKELYPYAVPNQKNGAFKCYSCRNF